MQTVTTIGLDIAKSVFQVHGIDAEGSRGHQSELGPPSVITLPSVLPGTPLVSDLGHR